MWFQRTGMSALLLAAGIGAAACDYGDTESEMEVPETEYGEGEVMEEVQIAPEQEPPEPGATDTL